MRDGGHERSASVARSASRVASLVGGFAVGPSDDVGEGESVGEHRLDRGAGLAFEGVAHGARRSG